MFDVENFVAACRVASKELNSVSSMKEVVEQAVRNRGEITAALGRPDRGGFDTLCRTDDLTVLRFVWPPRVQLFPHDHQMRAVIGIYEGAEDNEFFRRSSDGLQRSGGCRIEAGAVMTLGHDVVHAVT